MTVSYSQPPPHFQGPGGPTVLGPISGGTASCGQYYTIQTPFLFFSVSCTGTIGNGQNWPGIEYNSSGGNFFQSGSDFFSLRAPHEQFKVTGSSSSGPFAKVNDNIGNVDAYDTAFVSFVNNSSPAYVDFTWTGQNGLFQISHTFSTLVSNALFSGLKIKTTITAFTDLTKVQFSRVVNPDQDAYLGFGDTEDFLGYNSSKINISASDICISRGFARPQLALALFANSQVPHGAGISTDMNQNPQYYLSGFNQQTDPNRPDKAEEPPYEDWDGDEGDNVCGIGFNLGNIATGKTATCEYQYFLSNDDGSLDTFLKKFFGPHTATDVPTMTTTASKSSESSISTTESITMAQSMTRTHSWTVMWTATRSFSDSKEPTGSVTGSGTRSRTRTMSSEPSGTTSHTPSPSRTPSNTRTPTPTFTPTSTDSHTHTLVETLTHTVDLTSTVVFTLSRGLTLTKTETKGTCTIPLTMSRIVTKSLTKTTTRTHPTKSLTRSIGCVNESTVLDAVGYIKDQPLVLFDTNIMHGYQYETTLVSDTTLMNSSLYLKWYMPLSFSAFVNLLPGSTFGLPSNENGFAKLPGTQANITIDFPDGLVSSIGSDSILVRVTIPAISSFLIDVEEHVTFAISLQDMLFATICEARAAATTSSGIPPAVNPFSHLVIVFDVTIFPETTALSSVSSVVSVVAPIGAALAAPQLQVLVVMSMLPCSGSYQQGALANYRALAPAAISASFEGVILGNIILTFGFCAARGILTFVISVVHRLDMAAACAKCKFPALPIIVYSLTFPGTAFASMQLLATRETSAGSLALASITLLVVVLGIPIGGIRYIQNHLEMHFDVFDYGRWQRGSSPLFARFLNVILLPIGSWQPDQMRQMMWMFVTRQCRREYLWLTLPLWSPMVVACLGVIHPSTTIGCAALFGLLALLHLLIALIVVWFRPLQSTLEDILFVVQTFLTALVLSFSASLLILPGSTALRAGAMVLAFAIIAVTMLDVLYNIFLHAVVIPRLHDHLPHTYAFCWPLAQDGEDGDEDQDSEMASKQRIFDLYANDPPEDPPLVLEENDAFLDMLMQQQQTATGGPVGDGGRGNILPLDDDDDFINNMLHGTGAK